MSATCRHNRKKGKGPFRSTFVSLLLSMSIHKYVVTVHFLSERVQADAYECKQIIFLKTTILTQSWGKYYF